MAVPIVAAGGTAAVAAGRSATTDGGMINTLLKILLIIGLVIGFVLLLIAFVGTITYWDKIVAGFTTGFLGWINPFDSSAGDTAPPGVAEAGKTVSVFTNLWKITTYPFRRLF